MQAHALANRANRAKRTTEPTKNTQVVETYDKLHDRIDPEEIADWTNEVPEPEQELQEQDELEEHEVPEQDQELQDHEVPEPEQDDQEFQDFEEDLSEEESEEETRRTRSGRAIVKPTRYIEQNTFFCIKQTRKKTYIE
jgi:hypothetical protein